MASTYTTNKSIEKPAYNDYVANPTGWSGPVNSDWDIIDKSLGGTTVLNPTSVSGTVNLTATQYQAPIIVIGTSVSGSATLTANITYTIPSGVGGVWSIFNNTTGSYTITFSNLGGGTTETIQQGSRVMIYSDGTNIRKTFEIPDPIPSGVITMWSGSIASIPSGWFLCDGTNGTPNLRDRFVVGAGSTYAVAATGGSADAIVVSHTHTATSSVTDPGHFHGSQYDNRTPSGIDSAGSQSEIAGVGTIWNYPTTTNTTGITVSTTVSSTGSSGTNANLPPYYALAYIMKA